MTIEIVDFPINSMVIFHSYVNVYQRVSDHPILLGSAVAVFFDRDIAIAPGVSYSPYVLQLRG
jgi:hypothetical protein